MTQQLALAALEQLVKDKKVHRTSLAFKTALKAIQSPGVMISCGTNTGSGRFSSSKSWLWQTASLLDSVGVIRSTGNSAPKGGKVGDNIVVHFQPTSEAPADDHPLNQYFID